MTRKKLAILFLAIAFLIISLALVNLLVNESKPEFTVTYDLSGGIMEESETVVTLEEQYVLPTPTREGYKFIGWYRGDSIFSTMGVWSIEENVHLKAAWEIRDENGFVYEVSGDGYVVSNYKGLVDERIVVPDTYCGKKVVGVKENTFAGLKKFLNNGEIKKVLIYVPSRLEKQCENIAFDGRVEIVLYDENNDTGFVFSEKENVYSVEDYVGEIKNNIILLNEFRGLPVTSIAKDALKNLQARVESEEAVKLVTVYIPDTVGNFLVNAAVVGKMRIIKYSEIDENGLVYLNNSNKTAIVGYVGEYGESVTVPYEFEGLPVTDVGSYAFYGTENYISQSTGTVFSINLPESITVVHSNSFENCSGARVTLYYIENGEIQGSRPGRIYDWISSTVFEDNNIALVEVVCQFRQYFGANRNPSAKYYVRCLLNGGEISEGDDGCITEMYEDTFSFSKPYKLPIPVKKGYTFDGWYFGDEHVPNSGDMWGYTNYIAIEARWSEI